MGLLTSFGTGYMLLSNGIMVGAFQTFFYQHDLLWESSLAIWLHGTLEIWAIIVAGAAGLALGNGWLFPCTYSRLESFRRGAKRGLKIVIGTVPKLVSNPIAKQLKETITLLSVMPKNIGTSERLRFGRLSWPVPPDWL